MYRLLLIAQPTESTDSALWKEQNFDPVCICPDVCSALKLHAEKHFDAIGVTDPAVYKELYEQLKASNESVPAFTLPSDKDQQSVVLKDVRHLLHRLNVDYTDEQYTLSELSRLVQYEMLHNLLSGKSNDAEKLIRWFNMLRSDIPLELPCRIYTLGLPQGDLYLEDRWHHGQNRLQKALERNFFGHIDQIAYCAVSFLSPVDARLLLVPNATVDIDQETDTLDNEVIRSVNDIKSYLDLNINVYQAGSVACVTDIAMINNSKED